VFDYIEFSKFHTNNGDDTLPRGLVIIIASPLQPKLHERALMLGYTHIVCLGLMSPLVFVIILF